MILLAVVAVFVYGCGYVAFVYLMPPINKLFSLIWEDPSQRQENEALNRIHELGEANGLTESATEVIVSTEMGVSQDQLRKLLSAYGENGLISNANSKLGRALRKLRKLQYAETGGQRRKKRPMGLDETPDGVADSIEAEDADDAQ